MKKMGKEIAEFGAQQKGKHGKFENLWKGPFKIAGFHGNNTYILQKIYGGSYAGGPINGRFLKHYAS